VNGVLPIADEATTSSVLLAQIFPATVATAERRVPGERALLHEIEARACEGFSVTRLAEFAAGRDCARRALRAASGRDVAILRRKDRRPQWPAGFVGSITHTAGFCGAVAASSALVASLGVDAERTERVSRDLWESIFVAREIDELAKLASPAQQRTATVIFSAKEAFYKCQSPLTGMWIDFDEVAALVRFADERSGTFTILPLSDACRQRFERCDLRGRFCFDDGFVVTGMLVANKAPGW
jgi:4'-phosphopantetheinyl transferase EntD